MILLILGGSGSGKSSIGEEYAEKLSVNGKRYYVATMRPVDEEGQKKIARHQRMREDKAYITIEQPTDIAGVLDKIDRKTISNATALIDCLSNLTANEMFLQGKVVGEEETICRVVSGIRCLTENFGHVVIVGNNVFEDGNRYDETTMGYIRVMGRINRCLAETADIVIEVVAGIPIVNKGGELL